jgi:excisionase family DNA binding protein
MTAENILTVEEVATILKVLPADVKRLYRQGKLHGARIGGSIRFRPSSIDRFMNEEEGRCAISEPRGSTQGQIDQVGSSSGTTPTSNESAEEALVHQIAGKLIARLPPSSSSGPTEPGQVLSLHPTNTGSSRP